MNVYSIEWAPAALAELHRLDATVQRRIGKAVSALSKDPLRRLTRLVNSPYYRLRVGDYRVIVAVEHHKVTIVVLEVAHRRTAYR